jgi:hypothetical protein
MSAQTGFGHWRHKEFIHKARLAWRKPDSALTFPGSSSAQREQLEAGCDVEQDSLDFLQLSEPIHFSSVSQSTRIVATFRGGSIGVLCGAKQTMIKQLSLETPK